MMIIPEIETVVLFVPRTGSGTLRRALAAKYPGAMLLYRHMEADGVPAGYDRWRRVGVLREPLDRLRSLWRFLGAFGGDHDKAYVTAMRAQGARPFEEWLLENDRPFTSPYDSAGYGRYWPHFTVRHPMAENRKSQFLYLRPDLGTEVWPYKGLPLLARSLGIEALTEQHNATVDESTIQRGDLSDAARDYLARQFRWDSRAHELLTVGLINVQNAEKSVWKAVRNDFGRAYLQTARRSGIGGSRA